MAYHGMVMLEYGSPRRLRPCPAERPTPWMVRGLPRRALTRQLAALPLALAGCAGPRAGGRYRAALASHRGGLSQPARQPGRAAATSATGSSFFWRRLRPRAGAAGRAGRSRAAAGRGRGRPAPPARRRQPHLARPRELPDPARRPHHPDRSVPFHACLAVPPLGPERFAPPGLAPISCRRSTFVLLSHNHYDHLDLPTIEALPGKERIQAIVPLRLGRLFHRAAASRACASWTGTSRSSVDGLDVTGAAGDPFLQTHACSIATRRFGPAMRVQSSRRRLHFAGDTGYGPIFPELGARRPPVRPRAAADRRLRAATC